MKCPHCGETVMVEYDPALRRWFCAACGRLFRAPKPEKVTT
jgi:transposase-like protein